MEFSKRLEPSIVGMDLLQVDDNQYVFQESSPLPQPNSRDSAINTISRRLEDILLERNNDKSRFISQSIYNVIICVILIFS